MESLRCLFINYDIMLGHVMNNPDLMTLIQVVGTRFHIAWEK